MKYSVPNRKSIHLLKQADEIKIQKSDFRKTIDYIHDYPNAEIVLCVKGDDLLTDKQITLAELQKFNEEAKNRFFVELEEMNKPYIDALKDNNIKFFWKFPATTFLELKTLKDIGASQALIDGPIFFQKIRVQRFGMRLRAFPNVCHNNYLPMENGLYGTWILPDDQDLYEDYITTFEFVHPDLDKWEAVFKIYKSRHYIGDLSLLLINFNYPKHILAPAVPKDLSISRLNCGQQCMYSNHCKLCQNAMTIGLAVQEEELEEIRNDFDL